MLTGPKRHNLISQPLCLIVHFAEHDRNNLILSRQSNFHFFWLIEGRMIARDGFERSQFVDFEVLQECGEEYGLFHQRELIAETRKKRF
jgi:hypothetical protein